MRVVNIYKKNENGNKKFLNKAFFESKKGKWNIEENLKEIMLRQNHEDILKLGTNAEMENIGVEVFYFHDGIWCSWDADDLRKKSIKCAEVLVPYKVPYEYVVGAAVVNEIAKEKLIKVGFDKKIYVMPKMFF